MDWKQAPGWLGEFVRWSSSNNGFPLAWHFWGAVVATGVASARRLWVGYDSKPIWLMQSVVLVGRSGLGKGWIISETQGLIEEALPLDEKVQILDGAPTPESLVTLALTEEDGQTMKVPMLLTLDEFSSALSKRDYMAAMSPRLTTLLQNGDRYEDPRTKERRRLRNLMYILFGGSTEDFLESQMSPDAIGGGLPSRAIWPVARTTDRFVPGRPGENDPVERLRLSAVLSSMSEMSGEIRLDSVAESYLEAIQRRAHDSEEGDPRLSGHYSRKPRTILRLAGLASVAQGKMAISEDDLIFAEQALEETETPMFEMFERVSSTNNEKLNLYVLKRLGELGGSLPPGTLFHACRYKLGDKASFERSIETLLMQGRIKQDGRLTLV